MNSNFHVVLSRGRGSGGMTSSGVGDSAKDRPQLCVLVIWTDEHAMARGAWGQYA